MIPWTMNSGSSRMCKVQAIQREVFSGNWTSHENCSIITCFHPVQETKEAEGEWDDNEEEMNGNDGTEWDERNTKNTYERGNKLNRTAIKTGFLITWRDEVVDTTESGYRKNKLICSRTDLNNKEYTRNNQPRIEQRLKMIQPWHINKKVIK